jgi:hypothetical protein
VTRVIVLALPVMFRYHADARQEQTYNEMGAEHAAK